MASDENDKKTPSDDDEDEDRKPAAKRKRRSDAGEEKKSASSSKNDDAASENDSVPIPEIERMGNEMSDDDEPPKPKKTREESTTPKNEKNTAKESEESSTPDPPASKRRTRASLKKPPPPPAAAAATDGGSPSRYPRRNRRRTLSEATTTEATTPDRSATKRAKVETSTATSTATTPTKHNYQVVKISEKTGKKEIRTYETRSLIRLIPPEQEDQVREECKVEFADLLKTDEPLVPDKKKGVDPQTARSNVLWEDNFLDYLVFKKVYGHGIVPKVWVEKPSLGSWTVRNRRAWKNKDKKMTPSRKRRLDEAGFVWAAKQDPSFWKIQNQTTQDQAKFDKKFNMLLEYKREHGDCLVPKEYKPNMILARWVSEMRKQKKAKTEGRMHNLSDEKEQRLVDVGFVFNSRTRELLRASVLNRFKDRWDASFAKLLAFKKKYGHTAVPRRWKEDEELSSWAMRQRSNGKKLMKGEESYLTQERFDQLQNVEFVWYLDFKKYPMASSAGKTEKESSKEEEEDEDASDEENDEEEQKDNDAEKEDTKEDTKEEEEKEEPKDAMEEDGLKDTKKDSVKSSDTTEKSGEGADEDDAAADTIKSNTGTVEDEKDSGSPEAVVSSPTKETPRNRRSRRSQSKTSQQEEEVASSAVVPKKSSRSSKKATAEPKVEPSSRKTPTRRTTRSSRAAKAEKFNTEEPSPDSRQTRRSRRTAAATKAYKDNAPESDSKSSMADENGTDDEESDSKSAVVEHNSDDEENGSMSSVDEKKQEEETTEEATQDIKSVRDATQDKKGIEAKGSASPIKRASSEQEGDGDATQDKKGIEAKGSASPIKRASSEQEGDDDQDEKKAAEEDDASQVAKSPTSSAELKEALLKANKGRWVCELSGKDEHLSYVSFLAHQAVCEGLPQGMFCNDLE